MKPAEDRMLLKWLSALVFVTAVLCAGGAAGQSVTTAADPADGAVAVEPIALLPDSSSIPDEPIPVMPTPTTASAMPATAAAARPATAPGHQRGVHPAWAVAVERFARAVEAGDADRVSAAVADGAAVHAFRHGRLIPPTALVERVAGHVLLGYHAYHHPPTTLASDVAADVAAAAIVPAEHKQLLVPTDEGELHRSNDIAATWVAQTLAPERAQAIGVIVWWDVVTARPAFMLVRGDPIGAKEYRIAHVVFGNPLARGK
jgi:hypothetical protein